MNPNLEEKIKWEKDYMVFSNGCLAKRDRLEPGTFIGSEETKRSLNELLSQARQQVLSEVLEVIDKTKAMNTKGSKELDKLYLWIAQMKEEQSV